MTFGMLVVKVVVAQCKNVALDSQTEKRDLKDYTPHSTDMKVV